MTRSFALFFLLVFEVIAQDSPVFEPLSSNNRIQALVDEHSSAGTVVITVRARGPVTETVVYGIDLPTGSEGIFEINPSTGNIIVGASGTSQLAVRNRQPRVITFNVFAYFLSTGLNGSRGYLQVIVTVRDINSRPSFSQSNYTISIMESVTSGTTVARFIAMDEDLGDNGAITYTIVQIGPIGSSPRFIINSRTGNLELSGSVLVNTEYQLWLTATDEGDPPLNSTAIVLVRVDPAPPTFQQVIYSISVAEFSMERKSLVTVQVNDENPPDGLNVVYSISSFLPVHDDVTFSVGLTTGVVAVNGTLDRETSSRYLIIVDALKDGRITSHSQATVIVSILDVNEPPVFVSSHYVTSISEGTSLGQEIFSGILAIDSDEGINAIITFSIVEVFGYQTISGTRVSIAALPFLIFPSTGVLTANADLEREAVVNGYHYYEIIVAATDGGSPSLTSNTTLTVSVLDVNDNPPQFNSTIYTFNITENLDPGALVGVIEIMDQDQGLAAEAVFSLIGKNSNRFSTSIRSVTRISNANSQPPMITVAAIITTQALDREDIGSYQFSMTAQDQTSNPLSATVPVFITILDVNDNSPIFPSTSYIYSVSEGTEDSLLSVFNVTDVDLSVNSEVDFVLDPASAHLFTLVLIEPQSTELYINHILDREAVDVYFIQLYAVDRGTPSRTGETNITLIVTDENDNAPTFSASLFSYSIVEDNNLGTVVGHFEVTDGDLLAAGTVIVSLIGTYSSRFSIEILNRGNPVEGRIVTAQTLDREDIEIYHLMLMAADNTIVPLDSSVPVTVTVLDINDNPPIFSRSVMDVSVQENTNGTTVSEISATDADTSSNAVLDFTLDSAATGLFSLRSTGPLSTDLLLIHTPDREMITSYTFTIIAVDGGTVRHTAQSTININVIDENDNTPFFDLIMLNLTILENVPTDSFVRDFEVTDLDIGSGGEVSFNLTGMYADRFLVTMISVNQFLTPQLPAPFTVTQGRIETAHFLNREDVEIYQLTLVARDASNVPLSASVPVMVTILDANDNPPMFSQPFWEFTLPENINSTLIMEFNVTDNDIDNNSLVDFSIETSVGGLFSLERTGMYSSELYLNHLLDRETRSSYFIKLFVFDRGTPSLMGQTNISITVLDQNDNAPVFSKLNYVFKITENLPLGYMIGSIIASDADISSNSQVAYYGSTSQLVRVDNRTGELVLLFSPDFENASSIKFQVIAVDFGLPQMSSTATVTLAIVDANDFPPVFAMADDNNEYSVTFSENIQVGSQVVRTSATDIDQDIITYSIINGNELGDFAIENNTGSIIVFQAVDRERIENYILVVMAEDNGAPKMSSHAVVNIEVTDVNDNIPIFIGEPYVAEINEGLNGSVGVLVLVVLAMDGDIDANGNISYLLLAPDINYFNLNPVTGEIRISSIGLDFEVINSKGNPLVFTLIAQDGGDPMRFSSTKINITVTDANDNSPIFAGTPYSFTVREHRVLSREVVFVVVALDADSTTNGEIVYSITGETRSDLDIDPATGAVSLRAGVNLDRETPSLPHNDNGDAVFSFGVAAMDQGTPTRITYTTVMVYVSDVNDNIPVFQSSTFSRTLSESLPVDTKILNLVATDADFGNNSMTLYSILSEESAATGTSSGGYYFHVEESNGALVLQRALDRETSPNVTVTIVATDQLSGASNLATVFITVTDSNDNSPIFVIPKPEGYLSQVPENATIGTEVIQVMATDIDQGSNQLIAYSIASNATLPFAIDPLVGIIVVSGQLDRETISEYQVVAVAQNVFQYSQMGFATVRIIIEDINDNVPVFDQDSYSALIAEELPIGSKVSVSPLISGTDRDTTQFLFSLSGQGSENFAIDKETGIITTLQMFDYELVQEFSNFLVIIYDQDFLNSNASLQISVQDVNDNSPIFESTIMADVSISEATDILSEIFVAVATDADSTSNSQLLYSFGTNLNLDFLINSISGAVVVNRVLDFEIRMSYVLDIIVSDGGYPSRNDSLSLTVTIMDENDNSPMIMHLRTFSVRENVEVGEFVGEINATDADSGDNSVLVYEIVAGNEAGDFIIDSESGSISTSSSIDREEFSYYSLTIEVRDSATFPLGNQTSVTIAVLDENDNTPILIQAESQSISELLPPSTLVDTVTAIDIDEGDNGRVTYTLSLINPGQLPFIINRTTGEIRTTAFLDYEVITQFSFLIIATDNGSPVLFSTLGYLVDILDENDNIPQFSSNSFTATIPENLLENSFVKGLTATDLDSGTNGQLRYSLVGDTRTFQINSSTGIVTVRRSEFLDLEGAIITFFVQVVVQDMGMPPESSQTLLIVNLTDVNDNAPHFPSLSPISIEENRGVGSIVTIVTATDADQGDNAAIIYRILSGNINGVFAIFSDGSIQIRSSVNYEDMQDYSLAIQAEDGGSPQLVTTTTLRINILDINDNIPEFVGNQLNYDIAEDVRIGHEVVKFEATDRDSTSNGIVEFRLISVGGVKSLFSINSSTGSLTTQQMLDRENTMEYLLIVEVADRGMPSLAVHREFTVEITDVNDNAPRLVIPLLQNINESQNIMVPFTLLEANDFDDGVNAIPYYFVTGGPNKTSIKLDSVLGLLYITEPLDFDAGERDISVQVSVLNQNSYPGPNCLLTVRPCSTTNLTFTINDVNDNPPVFTQLDYDFSLNRSTVTTNTLIGTVRAMDIDSNEFGTVQYRLDSTNKFSVGASTGKVNLVDYNPQTGSNFIELNITAFDNMEREPSLSSSCLVKVYLIENGNLVILNVLEDKATVDQNLNEIMTSLESLGSKNTEVFFFDTREFVYSMQAPSPTREKGTSTLSIVSTNITTFGANNKTKRVLNSNELLVYLNDNLGTSGRIGSYPIQSIKSFPSPVEPMSARGFILYVYIAAGIGGGILLLCFMTCIMYCCLVKNQSQNYKPSEGPPREKNFGRNHSEMRVFTTAGNLETYENPTWDDLYNKRTWSDDKYYLGASGRTIFEDRSMDESLPGKNTQRERKNSNKVKEEVIKVNQKSLSKASTMMEHRSKVEPNWYSPHTSMTSYNNNGIKMAKTLWDIDPVHSCNEDGSEEETGTSNSEDETTETEEDDEYVDEKEEVNDEEENEAEEWEQYDGGGFNISQ